MVNLKGKNILVTGSGKGIGRGIAEYLAGAGANLLLHYNSTSAPAEELANLLRAKGATVYLCQANLGTESGIESLFTTVKETLGTLDAAVNNAGWDPGYVDKADVDYDLYYKLTDINIKGTLFCCLKEIEIMELNANGGSIINIGSVQMDKTVRGRTLYAMSKGAIHSLTGQLALEVGRKNIRVNNIAPGYIEVERMTNVATFNLEEVISSIPINRVGQPKDIGAFVAFLASDEASFITGQSLVIDGGVARKLK